MQGNSFVFPQVSEMRDEKRAGLEIEVIKKAETILTKKRNVKVFFLVGRPHIFLVHQKRNNEIMQLTRTT